MSTGTLKTYNTFVRGIVTEAGPLTYPENASLDEENFVLGREGARQRRLGMDLEEDYVLHTVTLDLNDALVAKRWYNVANDPSRQFVVVQTRQTLRIFDANAASTSAALVGEVTSSTYLQGNAPLQADSIEGFFVFASGTRPVAYLSYDPVADTFTVNGIQILIRDFLGVDDGLRVDERPAGATNAHTYNLYNQGWNSGYISAWSGAKSSQPANNQQWFIGKDTNGDFDPDTLDKMDFGTTPAPKGRMVIDAFNRSASRTAVSGIGGLPDDVETGRPSTVCAAFQRLFYSGIPSSVTAPATTRPNMTGWVLYTRVVRSAQDFAQCYTDADPTSETDSDPVDTDGGYIVIPNSGKIHRLVHMGSAVLVFAEKGVWAITGGESGFTHNDHQVGKLTDFGVQSPWSIVVAEDTAYYWNIGGIYALGPDEMGDVKAKNITEESIQTLYNTIGLPAKRTAIGNYDAVNRRITWLYNDEDDYREDRYARRYNVELVLDTVLGAFTKNRISAYDDPSPYVAGYVDMPSFLLRQDGIRTRGETVTKYLVVQFIDVVSNTTGISFAHYRDPTFHDWASMDGVGASFKSYLLTGDEIMGDAARKKNAAYLFVHMKQTERLSVLDPVSGQVRADNPSGLLVQARWDFSDNPISGKWQEPVQVYRLLRPMLLGPPGTPIEYGHEVVITKNRLTGMGRGLRLYMESEEGKDAYIYGWVARYGGNVNV